MCPVGYIVFCFRSCSLVVRLKEMYGALWPPVYAIRSQPEIQPPADYVPPTIAAIGGDPIAKADVVVFAARPGDAAVSAYATISQAVAQGKRVVIVFVTNGDAQTIVARELADLPADATPTPRQYLHGAAVLQETALKVAENSFGLTWEDVIFLSYPDGILHQLAEEAPDQVIRSPYTEKTACMIPTSPRIASCAPDTVSRMRSILYCAT